MKQRSIAKFECMREMTTQQVIDLLERFSGDHTSVVVEHLIVRLEDDDATRKIPNKPHGPVFVVAP